MTQEVEEPDSFMFAAIVWQQGEPTGVPVTGQLTLTGHDAKSGWWFAAERRIDRSQICWPVQLTRGRPKPGEKPPLQPAIRALRRAAARYFGAKENEIVILNARWHPA